MNLALNAPPGAKVHTLDLPDPGRTALPIAWGDRNLQLSGATGSVWAASRCRAKIEQLWADSAHFDATPYRGLMDFIFIDGAHSYEYVRNDGAKALAMLRPGVPA